MAKLTGKAKSSFLKRMADGRRRAAAGKAPRPKARRTRPRKPSPRKTSRPPSRHSNPELLVITNPTSRAELGQAVRQYRKFHGVNPKRALRRGKGKKARVLVGLGDMVEIVYEPRRGQRKRIHWFHKFKRRAILATDDKGRGLYIVDPEGRIMVDFSAGIVT